MSEENKGENNPRFYEKKIGWDELDHAVVMAHAKRYASFLSACKTERESVRWFLEQAQAQGFEPFDPARMEPGYRFYFNNREKGLLLGVVGTRPLTAGFNLVGSHVDAPRLDLKAQPLYEEGAMGFFKTHYYGGIKKYQWLSIPLALHGVVVLTDGTRVEVTLGEDADDAVFTIADLLPHLAREQMQKPMNKAVEGEGLNLLAAGMPAGTPKDKDRLKSRLVDLLHERFGFVEEDLISAELEVVPSGPCRDVGIDRAFVGGYGQDDRVCAHASFCALLDAEAPDRTALVLMSDKEEIGSNGNTGAQGRFLEYAVARLAQAEGLGGLGDMGRIMEASHAISADVSAGMDPNYKNLFDERNAPQMGRGVNVTKYTGSGGKYEANDASAETMGMLRRVFNEAQVVWQTGELGKVDAGGGGTIAKYLSQLGIETVDVGPALLGMHSPFEIADKADIYSTYRAYLAFLERR